MPESLFTRLGLQPKPYKTQRREFLTEVLAHLVNTDRVFRETFVEVVIPNRRIRRGFKDVIALPQQTLGRGIVDLVLQCSTSKVFVEVKVGARETETEINGRQVRQVEKYLS